MKNVLVGLAILSACSALGYVNSEKQYGPTFSGHLSINGVSLGMRRADVDSKFGRVNRVEYLGGRSITEGFGNLPGSCGFGNGTGVRFDSHLYEARVLGVHGFYLDYDGSYLCGELNSLDSPYGSRLEILRRKLGNPDLVKPEKDEVIWIYQRYKLSVETQLGRFTLGDSPYSGTQ